MKRSVVALALFLSLNTAILCSAESVLPVVDTGWYSNDGYHGMYNDNYAAGYNLGIAGNNYITRNFFVFDLSGLTGTITSARFSVYTFRTFSYDDYEVFSLFQVDTPPAEVMASHWDATIAPDIFDDLGSGTVYGSDLFSDQNITQTLILNSDAINELNAARGGLFVIGGAVTSLSGRTNWYEQLFGASDINDRTQLVLTTTPTPVSEPSALMLISVLLLPFAARKRS